MTLPRSIRDDRDEALELDIRSEYDAMNRATDRSTAQRHWERMVGLIQKRSSKQVARMERERGLQ